MNKEIGALWKNTSAKGNKYFAGNVEVGGEKIKIVVFRNRDASESNHFPDYRIYESEPPTEKSSEPKSTFTENKVNEEGEGGW